MKEGQNTPLPLPTHHFLFVVRQKILAGQTDLAGLRVDLEHADQDLIAEIQQRSNLTYRLYDWDRVDPRTGLPRPLHTKQALEVIDWTQTASPVSPILPDVPVSDALSVRLLLDDPHFHVEEWTLRDRTEVTLPGDRFRILFPVNANLRIRTPGQPAMILQRNSTCLLPAVLTRFSLQPADDIPAATDPVRFLVAKTP